MEKYENLNKLCNISNINAISLFGRHLIGHRTFDAKRWLICHFEKDTDGFYMLGDLKEYGNKEEAMLAFNEVMSDV